MTLKPSSRFQIPSVLMVLIPIITFFLIHFPSSFLPLKAQTSPPKELVHDMIDEISPDSLLKHVIELEDAGGTRSRITFTPGKDSAAAYIFNAFDRMPGLSSVKYDTFYIDQAHPPYDEQPQVNVVATIEGAVEPESYYVIGGHFDSTADRDDEWDGNNWDTIEAPGANDNGTGVAAVLELARVFSDPENGFVPDYTLVFVAFGAEERLAPGSGNHHGSRHFASQARKNGDHIRGMISIDMIGYNNNYDYTALVMHDNFMINASVSFGTKLYEANTDYDIGLIMNEPPFARGAYSDHDTFADEGYPSVLVIENAPPWRSDDYYQANPYYHKTTDTYDRVNFQLVRMVAQLNLATVASFGGHATDAGRPMAELAQDITLVGNYPNPFNPNTNIIFELPQRAHVALSVYDLTGNRIAVLVDETVSAGRHSVNFDASSDGQNLASGLYLYRLVSGSTAKTGKMTLIK